MNTGSSEYGYTGPRVPLGDPEAPGPCSDERVAFLDATGMVNEVLMLPDAPGNRELLELANRNYLRAAEDLMAAWDRMEIK